MQPDWAQRWPLLCVTVVDGMGRDAALAAVGATDSPTGMSVASTDSGAAQVLVETQSSEGVRPEVLRRASAAGRALAFAKLGDGRSVLGYAEHGTVVAVFEPPGPGSTDPQPALVLERLGVDPTVLPAADAASGWGFALIRAGFGVDVDEPMVTEPDCVVPLLPVLPGVPAPVPLPVVTATDARLTALLQQAPAERLRQAVSAVVDRLLETPAVAGEPVLAVVGRRRAALVEESADGIALRRLIADTTAAPQVRAVARTLAMVFAAPPDQGLALLLTASLPVHAADIALGVLADVEVTAEPVTEPPAGTTMMPLRPDMLPRHGRRAAPFGRPAPSAGTFLDAPADQ